LLWSIVLLLAIGITAVVAVRAPRSGSAFWAPLMGVWVALAAVSYLAYGESDSTKAALIASTLLLPVGITGLVARAERRRGHTVWRAGSIAFVVGALVGAVTPLLQLYLICAVTRDCL
jgi:hypothetical protein